MVMHKNKIRGTNDYRRYYMARHTTKKVSQNVLQI
ncbi:hypothetical protein KB186_12330 [Brevibacillus sp. AF8]|nr:hypothetical protein [Brevibacillus sp. AF8]